MTRRPAYAAIAALGAGVILGPAGLRVLQPQLLEDGAPIESLSEIALLICLFCLGLRLPLPLQWETWRIPLRLGTLTLLVVVALAAAAAHLIFDMNLSECLLLGAIVAPTDTVLAGDSSADGEESNVFMLSAESGINNGLSALLVFWVLGMMGLADEQAVGSLSLAAAWSLIGGCGAGGLIGIGMARWIKLLDPEHQAEFLEEAMVFATAALAYGASMALHTDGFLAVFAAGLALSHGGRLRRPLRNRALLGRLLRVAARLERFAWLVVVMVLGSLVGSIEYKWWMLLFAALLIFFIRPLAVRLGLGGVALPDSQWRGIAWFGGRGVACIYGLSFAINHGLSPPFARQLAGITLVVVVTSLLASTVSGLPLSRPTPDALDL